MKHTLAAIILALPAFALAVPSADNYHAVTNDWHKGNWTNVYELAQQRLAANTNDIVGAYIMKDYDIMFSDFTAMSNSSSSFTGVPSGQVRFSMRLPGSLAMFTS